MNEIIKNVPEDDKSTEIRDHKEIIEANKTPRTLRPNIQTPHAPAGIRQIVTAHITEVVDPECFICGELSIFKFKLSLML